MLATAAPNPWTVELIVVDGRTDGGGRRALSRDVVRGLLLRLRRGVYVERVSFEGMTPEQQHVVRMRALAAVSNRPVVFSHFSAAVVHRVPVLWTRLGRLHTTIAAPREGGQEAVVGHLLPLHAGEVMQVGSLLVTAPARTVIDVAAGAPFDEGVMATDAALRRGMDRSVLEQAIDAAGPRRAGKRMREAVAFGHPGGESAAESRTRTTLLRLGFAPPELQHRLVLHDGTEVFLDLLFPEFRVGGEIDGAKKLLDPAIARDARLALVAEKRREDAIRLQLAGLARWGWVESGSPERLAAILGRVGVEPATPRAVLSDYVEVARTATPRVQPVARR